MLFNKLLTICENYPNKLALNSWTYSQLIKLINKATYSLICKSSNEHILIDIFKASQLKLPLVILPKNNLENIQLPCINEKEFNLYLFSSGSTGSFRKSIRLPESMIISNAEIATQCQNISNFDKILTVCSLHHTGGINAQSIAGLLSGAHVIVKKFNAYNFFKLLEENQITITHLVPIMNNMLITTKKNKIPETLRLIVSGSDCISKHHAEFWLKKNINFMINYGLTEAGPIIINHNFTDISQIDIFDQGIPLGTMCWSQYKILESELHLKGSMISEDGWLQTGDCVSYNDNWFFYKGRISAGCKIVPKMY